jgi:hypothetical protein
MANMDKLMLWGAAGVMAAVGSLSYWKISQAPRIDPEIVSLEKEYGVLWKAPGHSPGPAPAPRIRWDEPVKAPERAHDWAAFIKPVLVERPIPLTPLPYFFLPVPVPGTAKADLHGITITWTVADREIVLKDHMVRKNAAPSGFIIQRQCEDGQLEEIGRVGPKDRSFTDLSTEPRMTYRYWVVLTGDESKYDSYPPRNAPAMTGTNVSTEARTPTATRVKLVGGGDGGSAILRVDTYDRTQKKWTSRMVSSVTPGKVVGTSGWTLRRLKFDGFTLVADLTDDEGVERVLTTKD